MMRSTRRVTAGAGLAGLLLVAGATTGVTAAGAEEAFDGCVPATITVHHVDETGSDLRDPLPVPGVIDGSYYFANESFSGYYFDSVVPKNTGSVSGDLDVTFTYLPIPEGRDGSIDPPPPSTFFACYVDESGTPIAERFEDFGMIGMTWETSALEIPGYRLVSSPEQETGTFTGVTGFVTYVYAPEE
ncbi:MucBP domain-containing protein, partial [Leucobacter sp. M11]|uniref:MucBP domain-containing protein n=1 Tax=Leucobacter sp. M11 TaxID=2993565 RepID=UPI002D7F2888